MSSLAQPVLVLWDRTPRDPDILSTLTPAERGTWQDINSAILNDSGEISVPELARRAKRTERAIYNRLKGLKAKGLIYAITLPGKCSRYYINYEYKGPRGTTPTPEVDFTPTPEVRFRGHPYFLKTQRKPPERQRVVSGLRCVCPSCNEAAGSIDGVCCGCGANRRRQPASTQESI